MQPHSGRVQFKHISQALARYIALAAVLLTLAAAFWSVCRERASKCWKSTLGTYL
jgi:hypothetical protein